MFEHFFFLICDFSLPFPQFSSLSLPSFFFFFFPLSTGAYAPAFKKPAPYSPIQTWNEHGTSTFKSNMEHEHGTYRELFFLSMVS